MKITGDNSLLALCSSLDEHGGWVLDTQFISTMGLPYLLAHGLGNPVADASGKLTFPTAGRYRVWVYTKNWTAYWKPQYAPGKFQLICGDYCREFGAGEPQWHWQDGGYIDVDTPDQILVLHDLTGFEGRCGAVLFTMEEDFVPPTDCSALHAMRRELVDVQTPEEAEEYDFVVVGAGITGMCAAIEAANRGLKTALINDRFVPGGNNSSEIRVWLSGTGRFPEFPALGELTERFEQPVRKIFGTENQPENYEDDRKMEILRSTENLTLYFGYYLVDAQMRENRIRSVELMHVCSGAPKVLKSDLFRTRLEALGGYKLENPGEVRQRF